MFEWSMLFNYPTEMDEFDIEIGIASGIAHGLFQFIFF